MIRLPVGTLRRALWTTALLACAACSGEVEAQQHPDVLQASQCGHRTLGDTRPRIGLALGGGGARGIAHISVLREIGNLHIPIDCVAGTSMGALVGGLYAAGMSVDDMQQLVVSTDWQRLFDDSLERPE